MFTKMTSLLKNISISDRTEIDNKMLKIAHDFIREEFLILHYSRKERRNSEGKIEKISNPLPEPLVMDKIRTEAIYQLKSTNIELQQEIQRQKTQIEEFEKNIAEYQCEITDVSQKYSELKLKLPALKFQKKKLKEILIDKEEECRRLD